MTQENRWAVVCKVCQHRYTWTGPLSPVPPCPNCAKAKGGDGQTETDKRLTTTPDVQEALDMAAEIESLAGELPEAGAEFGDSVTEKAQDIAANIRKHNRVTDGQAEALENMISGLEKWFGD